MKSKAWFFYRNGVTLTLLFRIKTLSILQAKRYGKRGVPEEFLHGVGVWGVTLVMLVPLADLLRSMDGGWIDKFHQVLVHTDRKAIALHFHHSAAEGSAQRYAPYFASHV